MLRYADDTVLIPENKEDLRQLLTIFEEESRKKGLQLNSKKIELMVISQSYSLRTSTSLSKVINSSKVLYWTHSDVSIQSLHNFKTVTKETGGNKMRFHKSHGL